MESEQFDIILDHYDHPRNEGALEKPDVSHEEGNPICGDIIKYDLVLDNNKVVEVGFSGKGCVISQATGSMLSELIKGKTLEEIKAIGANDIFSLLEIKISPIRYKCALLSLKVLKSALFDIREWPEVQGE